MVSVLPMFVWATHEEEPAPGDGLAVMFHLLLLISTLLFYAAYVFVTGRTSRLTPVDS
jgi:hypothetical protein